MSRKNWLSVGKATDELGCSVSALRAWEASGAIRVYRTPGGHRRYAVTDVQRLRGGA